MGQFEVLEFLKKNREKWFTCKMINKKFREVSIGSITTNMHNLRKNRLVYYKTVVAKTGHKMLAYKYGG